MTKKVNRLSNMAKRFLKLTVKISRTLPLEADPKAVRGPVDAKFKKAFSGHSPDEPRREIKTKRPGASNDWFGN